MAKKYRKRVLVSKGAAFHKLQVEDIAYFFSENRITSVISINRQNHVVDVSMEAMEEQLNPETFFRIKRYMIINIQSVEKIEKYFWR